MTISAPICRTTSVGRLFSSPPSTKTAFPSRTGEKAPGMDIVARNATASEPSLKTYDFPLTRSVATQRKGTGSASNDGTSS